MTSYKEMYDQAVALVKSENYVSTSFLQRRLHIGYNRAARIIESMEEAGIVSGMDSNGRRRFLGLKS